MEKISNHKRILYKTASFIALVTSLYGFGESMQAIRPFPVERQEATLSSEDSSDHKEWPIALAGVVLVMSGGAIGIKLDRLAD